MAKPSKKQEQTPHELLKSRASAYLADDEKLLKKHGLGKRIIVTFPRHTSIPLSGRLAVWLLKRAQAVIDIEFGLRDLKTK